MKRQVKKETSLLKKYLIKNRQLSLVYNKQVVYNVSRKYIYLYERGFLTMAFIDLMKAKAKQDKQTIVLPESKDKRTLIAAAQILQEGTADLIMVGKEEKIMDGAGWLEVDLTGLKVVDPDTDPKFDHYAETLFELRKHKGMTKEKAEELLKTDYITYGVMMVKEKDADGLVAGACHATADTLRPALQILKTAPGTELVSGFFIMDVPNCEYGSNGTFLFADCGLNQDPNSEELAAIADSSAKSFRALIGEKPIIAMLSHSTKGSAKHALVDKVTKAVEIAHEKYPQLDLDGELQLDAALVPEVAKSKARDPGCRPCKRSYFPEPGLRKYRLQAGSETG